MKPYRKIKRNYSKPFFSTRRRGLYGIPLLLFTLAIVSATVGLIAVAFLTDSNFQYDVRGYLGLERPEPTLFPRATRTAGHHTVHRWQGRRGAR